MSEGRGDMVAILPLTLLGVTVVLVAVMWHRPHPNHLFFLELLKTHLPHAPELKREPAERLSRQQ